MLERESGAVPTTLHDSLMARLDGFLPQGCRPAGLRDRPGVHLRHAGRHHRQGGPVCELRSGSSSRQLISVRGTPLGGTYTFKHALVRDAAYGSLLKSRRQELHARIAEALEQATPMWSLASPNLSPTI
jgi:hypothetical protein